MFRFTSPHCKNVVIVTTSNIATMASHVQGDDAALLDGNKGVFILFVLFVSIVLADGGPERTI